MGGGRRSCDPVLSGGAASETFSRSLPTSGQSERHALLFFLLTYFLLSLRIVRLAGSFCYFAEHIDSPAGAPGSLRPGLMPFWVLRSKESPQPRDTCWGWVRTGEWTLGKWAVGVYLAKQAQGCSPAGAGSQPCWLRINLDVLLAKPIGNVPAYHA